MHLFFALCPPTQTGGGEGEQQDQEDTQITDPEEPTQNARMLLNCFLVNTMTKSRIEEIIPLTMFPIIILMQCNTPILTAVNEEKMLPYHKGYHRRITGEEAERRLKLSDRHSYLTRYSKPQKCYILSVYEHQTTEDVVEHFEITIKNDAWVGIEGKDMLFDRIEELLHHYEYNTIDPAFTSIGQAYTLEDYNRDEKTKQEREREERARQEREGDKRSRQEIEERVRQEHERERQRQLQEKLYITQQRNRARCPIL